MKLTTCVFPAMILAIVQVSSSRALADVFVVDQSGSGDFLDIQAAIDAAHDDDVVIVRTGVYAGFVVNDKALQVLARLGASVRLTSGVAILQLSPNKQVGVHGFEIQGSASDEPALEVDSVQGRVRISACTLNGWDAPDHLNESGTEGASITSVADISFDGCLLSGGDSHQYDYCFDGRDGAPALVAYDSRAAITRSTLTGGRGGDGQMLGSFECSTCGYSDAGNGGDGALLAWASFLFTSGSVFVGGAGGIGWNCESGGGWTLCGIGGDGIDVPDGGSSAKILDCILLGGSGGGSCGPGQDVRGTDIEFLVGVAKGMEGRRLVASGSPVIVSFFGEPFDAVQLVASTRPEFLYLPNLRGVLHVGPWRRTLLMGNLDSTGQWSTYVHLPKVGAGSENLTLHLQAVFQNALNERTVSNPVSSTIVR